MTATRSLEGWRVLVTRERPGELAAMLEARGAQVVHVPLVAVVDPVDGGLALEAELADLSSYDWLVVTSPAGAERVGAAARGLSSVRLATVGAATARVLEVMADRPVDLVPDVQTAAALAADLVEFGDGTAWRVLILQGDLADDSIAVALSAAGHAVRRCVAYRTVLRVPESSVIENVDALLLASGSAARSWAEGVGREVPDVVVAIGPSTARVAEELGLKVTSVAADHSIEGLVAELERLFQN